MHPYRTSRFTRCGSGPHHLDVHGLVDRCSPPVAGHDNRPVLLGRQCDHGVVDGPARDVEGGTPPDHLSPEPGRRHQDPISVESPVEELTGVGGRERPGESGAYVSVRA